MVRVFGEDIVVDFDDEIFGVIREKSAIFSLEVLEIISVKYIYNNKGLSLSDIALDSLTHL